MKPKIEFKADKQRVAEGEVVEVTWSCTNAELVQFTIDNGFKTITQTVEPSGSKKFRLNRSSGKTQLVISATNDGKTYYKSVGVRVKRAKKPKTENDYDDYTGYKGAKRNGGKNNWANFKTKMKYVWASLTEKKKIAYIVLPILCLSLIFSTFSLVLSYICILCVIGYLLFTILKR
jgi:hypothetical protein